MSIYPVSETGSPADAPAVARRAPSSEFPARANSAPPGSGTLSVQEIPSRTPTPPAAETAQDEVQVQRDSESNGQIVIRYVDKSGNLILQIPSSQVLGLARALERTLSQQTKHRVANAGENTRGK